MAEMSYFTEYGVELEMCSLLYFQEMTVEQIITYYMRMHNISREECCIYIQNAKIRMVEWRLDG